MGKVVIGRPVNGISLNSELEFVLDDTGDIRCFAGTETARSFLREHGFSDEDMECLTFLESCGTCCKCGSPLFKSLLPEYTYQCFTCDEDFYAFEQNFGTD